MEVRVRGCEVVVPMGLEGLKWTWCTTWLECCAESRSVISVARYGLGCEWRVLCDKGFGGVFDMKRGLLTVDL